jgi:hypothetical protein
LGIKLATLYWDIWIVFKKGEDYPEEKGPLQLYWYRRRERMIMLNANVMQVYTLQPDAPQPLKRKLHLTGVKKRPITSPIDRRPCHRERMALVISYHHDISIDDVPASEIFITTTPVAHLP